LKLFFDSSALIPVFYADHPNHDASTQVFLTAQKAEAFCALHTLSEVYSVLTGLPIRPRIAGAEGVEVLKQILERLTPVALTEAEHVAAIEAVSASIVGGAIYDARIGRCPIKSGAEVLLTWNLRDFRRLAPAVAQIAKTPLDHLNPIEH
jgi:predicted nucleic acid-binding protein